MVDATLDVDVDDANGVSEVGTTTIVVLEEWAEVCVAGLGVCAFSVVFCVRCGSIAWLLALDVSIMSVVSVFVGLRALVVLLMIDGSSEVVGEGDVVAPPEPAL